MSKTTKFLAGIAIACSLALPAVAQDATADTVVASVNGTDITVGHLILLRDTLPDQYKNLPDDVLYDAVLQQAIQQTVLAQTVKDEPKEIALRLENEKRALLAGKAIEALVSAALTDEALQAAYDERFANAEPAREYNASHILVETEDEAKDLVTQLQNGADFAELAKEKSTGPSGPNGGSLGWFTKGMMVKPFEDAVLAMKDGATSEPVQTQFGWHVIKLNESRNKTVPSLEEVRGDLISDIQKKVLEEKLAELTDSADVVRNENQEINPAILRDLALVSDGN
jgi:peptidyl-prolyl cis-trans isomerase C